MSKDTKYLPRVVDKELSTLLEVFGAVLVVGPKWVGKTWTSEHQAKSKLFLEDRSGGDALIQAAKVAPAALLEGAVPRLIDEWQEAPQLWDAVRFEVDKRGQKGQFILTGSAVPPDKATLHTGTGRIVRMKMHTMSLFESGESNGTISLKELFDAGEQDANTPTSSISALSELTVERLADIVVRGGWPASIELPIEKSAIIPQKILEQIVESDVSRVDGVHRNPTLVRSLIDSLARHVASTAKITKIQQDMLNHQDALSRTSLDSYIEALQRIFIVENVLAWNPHIRSSSRLRKAAKHHFADPSLAAAALRVAPKQLLTNNFDTFGHLFESLCVRDLRIYAQAYAGQIFHYQDETGLEADAIIQLNDGRWAAVEIKMGSTDFDEAAVNLLKLAKKVKQSDNLNAQRNKKSNEVGIRQAPSFLMILSATPVAYLRNDGVYVVPIGCLCP